MKALMTGLCLIVWMIFTVGLALSVVGLILFIPKGNIEESPSTWMTIGLKLIDSLF